MSATVRPTQCASCPFRQGVPFGGWHEDQGLRDIETPSEHAAEVIAKIIRVSQKRRVE